MLRFMSSYMLDFDIIARLTMALLPHKGPYTLSMDRANWQSGTTDINAPLVVGITYEGVGASGSRPGVRGRKVVEVFKQGSNLLPFTCTG